MARPHSIGRVSLLILLLCVPATAEELLVPRLPETVSASHPLAEPWELLSHQLTQIRSTLDDYSFRLVKRERIEGQLQSHRFIDVKVRRASTQGEVIRPFAVFMRYLGPKSIAGRSVLFIEGENDGRMLVRQRGQLLGNINLKISPDSVAARRESLQPITDLGFERMALSLLDKLAEEMALDPHGDNTKVEFIREAKINERICTCIRVLHPAPAEGLSFHIAEVFVDDELNLPVRIASYDWPTAGGDPPLTSEFIYTRLQLNISLSDADFAVAQLDR